jgi:hypothetical protein
MYAARGLSVGAVRVAKFEPSKGGAEFLKQLLTAVGAASAQRRCVTGGSPYRVGTCHSFAADMKRCGRVTHEC